MKPCLYYARSYCKNRFLHGISDSADPSPFPVSLVSSPGSLDVMDTSSDPGLRTSTNRLHLNCSISTPLLTRLLKGRVVVAAGLMLGEDANQFGLARSQIDQNEMVNPKSK